MTGITAPCGMAGWLAGPGQLFIVTEGDLSSINPGQAMRWSEGDVADLFTIDNQETTVVDLSGASGWARFVLTSV